MHLNHSQGTRANHHSNDTTILHTYKFGIHAHTRALWGGSLGPWGLSTYFSYTKQAEDLRKPLVWECAFFLACGPSGSGVNLDLSPLQTIQSKKEWTHRGPSGQGDRPQTDAAARSRRCPGTPWLGPYALRGSKLRGKKFAWSKFIRTKFVDELMP